MQFEALLAARREARRHLVALLGHPGAHRQNPARVMSHPGPGQVGEDRIEPVGVERGEGGLPAPTRDAVGRVNPGGAKLAGAGRLRAEKGLALGGAFQRTVRGLRQARRGGALPGKRERAVAFPRAEPDPPDYRPVRAQQRGLPAVPGQAQEQRLGPRPLFMDFNGLGRGPNAPDPALELDPIHGQLRPVPGQPGIELKAIGVRGKAEEALEHDLGHQRAFEKLLVKPQAARGAAALQRPLARFLVILAVAARRLHLVEPGDHLAQPLPGVVRPEHLQAGHQIMEGKTQHRPAVLHLSAPGNIFRRVPGPDIPVHVAPRRGPRPEAPMVNIPALRRIARHHAIPVDPAQDGAGVFRRGKIIIDRLEVEKGQPVVVGLAVHILARIEPLRLAVPEPAVALGLHLLGMALQHRRVEAQHPAGDLPFGMLLNLAFEGGHDADGVVVLNRGVGIQPAKRQQIPVVIADAPPGMNHPGAVRVPPQPAPSVMAHPAGINHLALQRLVLGHDIAQGGAQAVDVGPQEPQVASPPEILGAAAHEVLAVDVVPGVVLREKRLQGHVARLRVAQPNAQLRHLPRPLRMPIHGNHRIADPVVRHRIEIHPARGGKVRPGRRGPLNKRLRRAQAGRPPAKLEEGRLEGLEPPGRRRHHRGAVGDLNSPALVIRAAVARPGQRPALQPAQLGGPPDRAHGVLEREMPAEAVLALVPKRKRPAELMGDARVLMRGHVALRVQDAAA